MVHGSKLPCKCGRQKKRDLSLAVWPPCERLYRVRLSLLTRTATNIDMSASASLPRNALTYASAFPSHRIPCKDGRIARNRRQREQRRIYTSSVPHRKKSSHLRSGTCPSEASARLLTRCAGATGLACPKRSGIGSGTRTPYLHVLAHCSGMHMHPPMRDTRRAHGRGANATYIPVCHTVA